MKKQKKNGPPILRLQYIPWLIRQKLIKKNSPFNDCKQICWMIFILQPEVNEKMKRTLYHLKKIWSLVLFSVNISKSELQF